MLEWIGGEVTGERVGFVESDFQFLNHSSKQAS